MYNADKKQKRNSAPAAQQATSKEAWPTGKGGDPASQLTKKTLMSCETNTGFTNRALQHFVTPKGRITFLCDGKNGCSPTKQDFTIFQ